MRSIINMLDRWSAKAIRFIRPQKHKSANVLTDDVHLKQENPSIKENEDSSWENEPIVLPDQYQITRTGQMIREPAKRRKYFHKRRYKL